MSARHEGRDRVNGSAIHIAHQGTSWLADQGRTVAGDTGRAYRLLDATARPPT